MKHKTLTKIPKKLKFCVDKQKKHDIMATVASQADVAELVYAHDSGSCEHCARAGSSPAICTKAFLETGTLFCCHRQNRTVLYEKPGLTGISDGSRCF